MTIEPNNKTLFEGDHILGRGPVAIQEWPAGGEVIIYVDGEMVASVDSSEFFKAFEVKS